MKAAENKLTHHKLDLSLPSLLAIAGGVFYLILAITFAFRTLPNMDEGSYLFKGWQYALGNYTLFAPYGFLVNKMVLSFLTWGWVQALTSPGLLAPRLVALLLSVLSMLGTWVVARRFTKNRWVLAALVWVMALNLNLIGIYSMAISQVLVNFQLVLILLLILGPQRPTWQIALAGVVVGSMMVTRENMLFMLPFFIAYIFIEHGWKKALIGLGSFLVIFAIVHAIYWPGILSLYKRWLPQLSLLASITDEVVNDQNIRTVDQLSRWLSLAQTVRLYFLALIGSVIVVILWPKKRQWRSNSHRKAALFLAGAFFILFIAHAYVTLWLDYCVYCLPTYTAYFNVLGLLLFVITLGSFNPKPSLPACIGILALSVLVCTLVGFSWFENVGNTLLQFPLPRFKDGRFLSGKAVLGDFLVNKFSITPENARMLLPTIVGFLLGVLSLIIVYLIFRRLKVANTYNYTAFLAHLFLAVGTLLTPLLTYPLTVKICSTNVIRSFENVGTLINEVAPPGSVYYLDGSLAVLPMLYTQDPVVLPPQINGRYSYKILTDSDLGLSKGFWTPEIGRDWFEKADVFIVDAGAFNRGLNQFDPLVFKHIRLPDDFMQCTIGKEIFIYYRR